LGAQNEPSIQPTVVAMKALRGVFFFCAAGAGCFADGSVKPEIAKVGRLLLAMFSVLFVIAEAMEMLT